MAEAEGDTLSPVVREKPAGTGGGATRPDPPPTKSWRTVSVSTRCGICTCSSAETCGRMTSNARFQLAVGCPPSLRSLPPDSGVVADVDGTEVRLTDEVFERTSPQSTTFLLRTNEGPLIT